MCVIFSFCTTVLLSAIVLGWHNCVQSPIWVYNALITFASVVILVIALM